MKVENMVSHQTGNKIANQFVITGKGSITFQSYETVIAKKTKNNLYIDQNALYYSQTTSKYLKQFLNTSASKKELEKVFKTGNLYQGLKVIVKNLNK